MEETRRRLLAAMGLSLVAPALAQGQGRAARLERIAQDLADLRVDVIITQAIPGAVTARSMGVTIQPELLARADRVIE